jgi:hypothetical protein
MIIATTANRQPALAQDGDEQFWRVDTRTPAHMLAAGVAADAVNCRFEDGRSWPRFGVSQQPWGRTGTNLVTANWTLNGTGFFYSAVNGFVIGKTYYWSQQQAVILSSAFFAAAQLSPAGTQITTRGYFVATSTTYYLWANQSEAILNKLPTDTIIENGGPNVCGYLRYNDPTTEFDTLILLTDDWRDQSGEDGGRGRCWRIVAGNAPQLVPMNGNDIYGPAQLVACDNALVMLRQENERHYFSAAAIKSANTIQLNCPPAWQSGDRVLFVSDPTVGSGLTGGTGPASESYCYVSNIGGNEVSLFADAGLTVAYTFTGGIGRFYLERDAISPGYTGNGAPPLLAQQNADGNTWANVGFLEVPDQTFVSAYNGTSKILTVPNHGLIPGDSVNYWKASGSPASSPPMSATPLNNTTPWFAYVVDGNHVILYTTQSDALANSGANYAGVSLGDANLDYIAKTTASSQPMPPGRLGYYTATQQLVIVNGNNNIYVSGPNDPLHYQPLTDQFTANLGEADNVTAISSISGNDSLIIGKLRSIYALYNFSQGPSNWALVRLTNEYGIVATNSVAQKGASLCFLSRRGYDRVINTAFGNLLAVDKPLSWDMKKYTDLIDWNNAGQAAAIEWNNRIFVALPLKLQATPSTQNNAVLSVNFLNSDVGKDMFAWEGVWTGPALQVYNWAIHPIAGEDRVTFCDYNGNANWLSDGWTDEPGALAPVKTCLTTRALFKGESVNVIKGEVTWDTFAPNITVQLKMAGVNEIETLGTFAYAPNAYQIANATPYNPAAPTASGWAAPHRADYSPQPNELLVAKLDTFQNTTEPLRARTRGRSPQLVITCTAGAMKLVKMELAAKPLQVRGTMT